MHKFYSVRFRSLGFRPCKARKPQTLEFVVPLGTPFREDFFRGIKVLCLDHGITILGPDVASVPQALNPIMLLPRCMSTRDRGIQYLSLHGI